MKTLTILAITAAGTVIASVIASALTKTPSPKASFTPEEWAFYKLNWPAVRTTN